MTFYWQPISDQTEFNAILLPAMPVKKFFNWFWQLSFLGKGWGKSFVHGDLFNLLVLKRIGSQACFTKPGQRNHHVLPGCHGITLRALCSLKKIIPIYLFQFYCLCHRPFHTSLAIKPKDCSLCACQTQQQCMTWYGCRSISESAAHWKCTRA